MYSFQHLLTTRTGLAMRRTLSLSLLTLLLRLFFVVVVVIYGLVLELLRL